VKHYICTLASLLLIACLLVAKTSGARTEYLLLEKECALFYEKYSVSE
jgi:hypothetical protein